MHPGQAHPSRIKVVLASGPLSRSSKPLHFEGAGAEFTFEGIVRPLEDGKSIRGLEYEVYSPMAERQLRQLGEELLRRFKILGLQVEHSQGFVSAGQCSFRLRIAAAHRREAIAAVDYYINALKKEVPIWKRALPLPSATPLTNPPTGCQ